MWLVTAGKEQCGKSKSKKQIFWKRSINVKCLNFLFVKVFEKNSKFGKLKWGNPFCYYIVNRKGL